MTAEYYFCI